MVDALGLPGRTFSAHMANVSRELSAAWVLLAPEGYRQRIGAVACTGSWGCIITGDDIPWVSLCVPMRPGKNSFVAPFEFEYPVRASCPRLRLYVLVGFADARLQYLAPWTSLVADMSLIWDMKTHHFGVVGGWAACAQSPFAGGLRVCMRRHLELRLSC